MAKTTTTRTPGTGEDVHMRTTGGTDKAQAVVLGIDASDSVIPADATFGIDVDVTRSAPQTAATSTVTNVAASATNVTLKASNASRKALYIFNAGTSNLFVKLGATATATTSFTYMIPPNGFWELPDDPIYTGIVDGLWTATGGSGANVTELT